MRRTTCVGLPAALALAVNDREYWRAGCTVMLSPEEPPPQPAVTPTPVGAGPEYRPRPAVVAPCAPAAIRTGSRAHIELFANGRVVVIPAGIGLRGTRTTAGRV